MKQLSCFNCKYYDCEDSEGVCRRHAPTAYVKYGLGGGEETISFTVWPMVHGEIDWCGEFVESENDSCEDDKE